MSESNISFALRTSSRMAEQLEQLMIVVRVMKLEHQTRVLMRKYRP